MLVEKRQGKADDGQTFQPVGNHAYLVAVDAAGANEERVDQNVYSPRGLTVTHMESSCCGCGGVVVGGNVGAEMDWHSFYGLMRHGGERNDSTMSSTVRKPPPMHQQQQPQRNPISLRLYKVLGTNYSDESTRQALQTLSELYYTPAVVAQTSLGKGKEKGKKDAEEWEEDDDQAEVLASPTAARMAPDSSASFKEAIPGEAAARARKNLRRDMEHKLATGSRQFLQAFEKVDQVCVRASNSPSPLLGPQQLAIARNWMSCRNS
jgi:hypothetical protein